MCYLPIADARKARSPGARLVQQLVQPWHALSSSNRPEMMRSLLMSFAVVACSGAYMGLSTRAPQQLPMGATLSRRANVPVAGFSPEKRKVTRPPVEKQVLALHATMLAP